VRPVVLDATHVASSKQDIWFEKLADILLLFIQKSGVDASQVYCFIEEPPVTFSGGKTALAGDSRGHTTWLRMGRRMGLAEMAWFLVSERRSFPVRLENKVWTSRLYPVIRKKKVGDGLHRISEAGLLADDASKFLSSIPRTYRIDVAESVLIAVAGLLIPLDTKSVNR
jgi:hypothetical protein